MVARRAKKRGRSPVKNSAALLKRLRQAERRLKELEERHELVMGAINEGVYDWNVVDDSIYYSESVQKAVGLPPELLRTTSDWRNRIHPEDLPRYVAGFVDYFKGKTGRYECDYRYRALDGSWRWARQHGMALRDKKGRVYRVIGSTGDITELKQAEEALRKSEERYALATAAAVEGIYEWNVATGTLYLTDRAKAFFAFPDQELTPAAWSTRVHAEDYPRYRAALVEHFKGGTRHLELQYRIADAGGGYKWVLDRGKAVRNADGRAIKLVGALSDITQRKLAELELTATAEILKVTSGSPGQVQPVLQAILTSASRLCEASFAAVFLYDGEMLSNVAQLNASERFAQFLQQLRARPSRETTTRRCALERRTIHTADLLNDPEFSPPEHQRRENVRTALSVPMMREDRLIGVITLWRSEVRPFSDKQVALVQTFADQALIAIENVRLFNETKEALEQQTATAEILRVISSSPTDVQPVFEAIVQSGIKLFEGAAVAVARPESGQVRLMAIAERDPEQAQKWRARFPFPLTREYMHSAAVLDCKTVEMPDVQVMDGRFDAGKRNFAPSGYRAMTVVPMVKDGAAIGTISVIRRAPGPLSDKQVALLQTFADQAVIAIENVRLFNETREALEQQKASGEVLSVISSSIADTAPVFDKILQSCQRLFSGRIVGLNLVREDGRLHIGAYHGSHREEFERIFPLPPNRDSGSGLSIVERRVVHYPDTEQGEDVPTRTREGCRAIGIKSAIFAPLLWEGRGLGAIFVGRDHVSSFSDKEIALLKTFADQAAIAIQNVRLFNETKEALEQQTATAEILRVISGSITDTQPVFDAIVRNCQRLFGGRAVALVMPNGAMLRSVAFASEGNVKGVDGSLKPWPLDRDSAGGACILDSRVIAVPDIAEAVRTYPRIKQLALDLGYRSALFVPLMREGKAIACLAILRAQTGEFSDKEISLASTFADQAVIAIENARLFSEIQDKSRQLEVANRHKSEFLANMSHELRTPLNAIIGFTRIVMRRSQEQLEPKQYENLEKILASGQHLLALINAILDLAKVEAGHVQVNASEIPLAPVLEQCVRTVEPLVKTDAVTLLKEFNGELPQVYLDEEKLRQIVINLLSNAVKFTASGSIRVQAHAANGSVTIAVADTGIGIAADKLGLIFEEFEQADARSTRVYGGTGLGLAIARRLARLMGGDIAVQSTLGSGSTFTLTLPVRYQAQA